MIKNTKAHFIQHVPFEDLAGIRPWLGKKHIEISRTRLYADEPLPDINIFDILIIMGGPMSTNEERIYPWLYDEKFFIENALKNDKKILGICLGAQLIADVMGAKIFKNKFTEIGWFPVRLAKESGESRIFKALPEKFTPFHWHGDIFEIPDGAMKTCESDGCRNQAFTYKDRVLGVQFHLESNEESIEGLISNCSKDIVKGKYIQGPEAMLKDIKSRVNDIHKLLDTILSNFVILD